MRAEQYLCKYFWVHRSLSIWPPGRRRGKEEKYKLEKKEFEPITYKDFRIENTLFGPRTVGTKSKPKRFDFVARPVPARAELVIVEVKAKRVTPRDVLQLLGYINFLRFLQKHLGKKGRRKFSDDFELRLTRRTKLRGILIGREIEPGLIDALPEEVLKIITLCTFKVVKGHWPTDLKEVIVHDRNYSIARKRAKEGRKLHSLYQ